MCVNAPCLYLLYKFVQEWRNLDAVAVLINDELENISTWLIANRLSLNMKQIDFMVFSKNSFIFLNLIFCNHVWCNARKSHMLLLQKQGKSGGFDSCDPPSNLKLDSNHQFFRPCDREIWWMTSKNNRALLLYYVKLCASFQIHWWIQTGFTVQKRPIRVEIGDMFSRVTLKFDGWPWKTIGHLFYPTLSFVQHFVAIGEFKLELQPGNAQFGSKSMIFLAVWPRNFTDDPQKQ